MLFRCRGEMEVVTSKDWYDRMTNDFVFLSPAAAVQYSLAFKLGEEEVHAAFNQPR